MAFDVAGGIVVLLGLWLGWRKGFARQMLGLTGLIVGLVGANWFSALAAPLVDGWDVPEEVRAAVLFLAVAVATWLAIVFVGSLLLRRWRDTTSDDGPKPSVGDRVFGGLLGAVKGAAVFSLLLFVFYRLPDSVQTAGGVQDQYAHSELVRLDRRVRFIEQVLATPEVKQTRRSLATVVEHYWTRRQEPVQSVSMPTGDEVRLDIDPNHLLESVGMD